MVIIISNFEEIVFLIVIDWYTSHTTCLDAEFIRAWVNGFAWNAERNCILIERPSGFRIKRCHYDIIEFIQNIWSKEKGSNEQFQMRYSLFQSRNGLLGSVIQIDSTEKDKLRWPQSYFLNRLFYLWIGKPESLRIFLALSTLVPSKRTTRGKSKLIDLWCKKYLKSIEFWIVKMILDYRQAFTTPLAMVAQSTIPPKTLTKIAFTCLSSLIMRNASLTWCSWTLPPTSRKFAGSPP